MPAPAAAVIVPEMLHLEQDLGLGLNSAIGAILLIAVTVDIVTMISGYTLCSGIAFSRGSLAWNILFGPVNVCS